MQIIQSDRLFLLLPLPETKMEIINNVGPVILIALIGFLLKRLGIFRREDGDLLLLLVFNVSLPALIFDAFTQIKLSIDYLFLPAITVVTISTMYLISYFISGAFRLPRKTRGTFIIGTMILNNGFLFPFIYGMYGDEGMARILLFDFMNGFLAFTWVYYLACRYGGNSQHRRTMTKKLLMSPPVWAIILSISLNLSGASIPTFLQDTFKILGEVTIPLIMIALGIYFSPRLIRPLPAFSAILIRMVIGLLIGYVFSEALNLEGLTRTIVLLGTSAPIGFNTLTFASLEDLDKDFAASLLSFSILAGMIYVPLFIFFNG